MLTSEGSLIERKALNETLIVICYWLFERENGAAFDKSGI